MSEGRQVISGSSSPLSTLHPSRITHHALRITHHALRITHHAQEVTNVNHNHHQG